MKQRLKRTVQIGLMSALLIMATGCGSRTVTDTYSFGNQVIRAGQSEITIALPYEMGKALKNVSDDGYPVDIYGSVTDHMVIEVEARRAAPDKALPTPDTFIRHSVEEFTKLGAHIDEDTVSLSGIPAKRIIVDYSTQGQKYRFSQYVFTDHDVLWNIVYQYPSEDEVGAGISKEIQDKIQVTQKKEG